MEIRKERNIPVLIKADSVFKPEAKNTLVRPEVRLSKAEIKSLPFESAVGFVEKRRSITGNSSIDQKLRIRDPVLKKLVDGEALDRREAEVEKLRKMSEFMKKQREAKRLKDEEWQQKYTEGVTKKHLIKKKERLDEGKRKKYSRLADAQKKQLRKSKV